MPAQKAKKQKKPIQKETKRQALLRCLYAEVDLLVTDLQSIRTHAGSPAHKVVATMVEEIKKFRKMRFLRSRRALEAALTSYIHQLNCLKRLVSARRRAEVSETGIKRLGQISFLAQIVHCGKFGDLPIEKLSRELPKLLKAKAKELRRQATSLKYRAGDISRLLTLIGH